MESIGDIEIKSIDSFEGGDNPEKIDKLLELERQTGDLEHIQYPALDALSAILDKAKHDPEKMKNLKGLLEYNPAPFSKN